MLSDFIYQTLYYTYLKKHMASDYVFWLPS